MGVEQQLVSHLVACRFEGIPPATIAKSGKLRPLAATSAKRALLLPSLPTLDESGLRGYDRYGWYGVLVPAGVSKDIIARVNAVIGKI